MARIGRLGRHARRTTDRLALAALGGECSLLAPAYEQLIAEDVMMTTAIQQGTFTRTERCKRLNELMAAVTEAEQGLIRSKETASLEEREQVRQTVENIRGMVW